MRKIVIAAFVSLDGVMQAPGGPQEDTSGGFVDGGWTFPFWSGPGSEEMGAFIGEVFSRPFDLLLGRRTYEIFAAHWPYVPADDPMGPLLTGVTKYVAAAAHEPLSWANSVRLQGDVAEAVRRLKAGEGPDLLIQGSTVLVQALLAHDLIDEIRLLVFPVLLGRGKRLFGDGAKPATLRLVSSKATEGGVMLAVYERIGAKVATGSFALETRSVAEEARESRLSGDA